MAPRLAHLPRSLVLGGLAAATAIGLLTGAVVQQATSTSGRPPSPVVTPSEQPTTEAGGRATHEVVEGADDSEPPAAKTSEPKKSSRPAAAKPTKGDATKPPTATSEKPPKSPKPPKPSKTKTKPTPTPGDDGDEDEDTAPR
jgi:hypothetical protein